ncbi:TPA_asm: hypothetical protein [Porphyromonas phage phage030a_KCOM2803]|uniref:Uncharacterized protein n=2 Tax=Nixviridae TaxID=3424665 RepID=A0AAT9JCR7_9CAUD
MCVKVFSNQDLSPSTPFQRVVSDEKFFLFRKTKCLFLRYQSKKATDR